MVNASSSSLRRARAFEKHTVAEFARTHFSAKWVSEGDVAITRQPVACFIATKDKAILGFACYDTTMRGFFGPTGVAETARGTGIGKALLMNTLELRVPLVGDNLGGVLYHDMGNVFQDLDKISFRTSQKNVQDFNYMVHAVGIGIRYRTPVGPVRFDIGYSPNSPRFFGFKGTREQLVLGGGTRLVQRINQLQFHFSLGQTF